MRSLDLHLRSLTDQLFSLYNPNPIGNAETDPAVVIAPNMNTSGDSL